MTTTLAPELDLAQAQTLAMKMMGDIASTILGTLSVVGDRLGLFTTLAEAGPITSEDFAARARIDPRYAREWLSAMSCHGYISYDLDQQTFSLSPEQAACLTVLESPFYLAGSFGLWPDYWKNVDRLTEVFQRGGGVPQDEFGSEWRCGFERFSRPGFVNNLCQDWIPAMPEVHRRLQAGGTVADVGCGNGLALIELARGYPAASFVGFDFYAPAIESARQNAIAAGVADRVRFEVRDSGNGLPGRYDLITCFDVVHDMPHPVAALREIREALTPGGSFFVLEFNFSSDLEENINHPFGLGSFGYAASVNYCMTTALAAGGIGTGTCMGERVFRSYAADAGFADVRRIDFPANPFNIFYEVRA